MIHLNIMLLLLGFFLNNMGSPVDIKNMAKHRETKYEFVSKTKERISIFMKEVS